MFGGQTAAQEFKGRSWRFLRTLVKDPFSVGAVAPSSRHLANSMVIGMGPGAKVVELGGGTGSVTQAILNSGVSPQDLLVIEQNEEFVEFLKERFPHVTVIRAKADSVRHHIADLTGPADFVVSGLPLMLFPAERKARLLSQVFSVLRPEGFFHQFTYGGRCPVERSLLQSLGLEASFLGFTLFNLPPAFVYRLKRRSA